MSRRMVIRCDQCQKQEDMVTPGAAMTSLTWGASFSMKPEPPEGWFERFAGIAGMRDFCSAECVLKWDEGYGDAPRGLMG